MIYLKFNIKDTYQIKKQTFLFQFIAEIYQILYLSVLYILKISKYD